MSIATASRVALLTEPHRVQLVERPLPSLGPTQAILRVSQCGVCTSEIDVWTGKDPEQLPLALGHEVAGVVEAVGDEVISLSPGDHVAAWVEGGGFADRIVVEDRFCVRVAEGLDYPGVAEPLACIVNAVELAEPRLGDDVVIIGAGFMGNLLQLVSALKGPRTITVADIRPDTLERARAVGATRVVDSSQESLAEAVTEITEGRGADVTYEVTGVNPGLDLAGGVTRMSGAVCIVGYHQGPPRTIDLGYWNWMAFRIVNGHFRNIDTIMAGMRAGMRLVSCGQLDVAPLVTHRFSLEQVSAAFEIAAAKPVGFVKSLVEMAP